MCEFGKQSIESVIIVSLTMVPKLEITRKRKKQIQFRASKHKGRQKTVPIIYFYFYFFLIDLGRAI